MKYIHNKSEVPTTPHFAIIEFSTYYVEGDERSRTAPGHGYPGHSEHKCDYIAFESEQEWKNEIDERMRRQYGDKNFVALRITPAVVKTQTVVEVV
jgi:hypothetical protein